MLHLSQTHLTELSALLLERTGLHYSQDRWEELESGINSLAAHLKFRDLAACAEWITTSSNKDHSIILLANYLTVRETYFYRDAAFFQIFEERILPNVIQSKGQNKSINLWSAGCCTGEEPYSVAIALARTLLNFSEWKVRILGTDLNRNYLEIAMKGEYKEWSFREPLPWLKNLYFSGENGRLIISQKIREMVDFRYFNLSDPGQSPLIESSPPFDIIFCRNVFIYLGQQQVKTIVKNFHRALTSGGLLIVGPSETSQSLFTEFNTLSYGLTTVYQKPEDKTQEIALNTLELDIPKINPPESFETALTYYSRKDYTNAERIALLLMDESPNLDLSLLLAKIYLNTNNISKATYWCAEALKLDKLHATAHYINGMILHEKGQFDDAIRAIERVLYINKDAVFPNFILATFLSNQGRTKEAKRYLNNILILLNNYKETQTLPDSDGMNAKQLKEMVQGMLGRLL